MAGKIKDYTGHRFGRLLVVQYAGSVPQGGKNHTGSAWLCVCDCGKERVVRRKCLTSGNTRSCGCLQREVTIKNTTTHGLTGTRTWRIYRGILRRCFNSSSKAYHSYGGRGITVCPQWRSSFEAFYKDMGECPDGYSIERIDVNGDYEPQNCKWIPLDEQHNNKQKTRFCVLDGERLRLRQADKKLGLAPGYLANWYRCGKLPPHIPNLEFEWR